MKVKIKYRFNQIWFTYFCIKIFYTFFALFVYSKFTLLGDSHAYLNGYYSNIALMFTSSNYFVGTIGHFFEIFLGPFLANIPFTILSFYGIYYSVSRLNLRKNHLLVILFLLSLPSFGVWSSISSKEAFSVFYMGILAGYIIDLLNNGKRKLKLIDYIAFYMGFLIKPQYMIAILSLILLVKIYFYFRMQAEKKLLIFLLYLSSVVIGLYIFRDVINDLSYLMPTFFTERGDATRENIFIVNDYDFFYNAPYGMFLAFWGPTLEEALKKPAQLIIFLESTIILIFYIYFLFILCANIVVRLKLNMEYISLYFVSVFWLLFVHYPFGLFNYGSALRYRENFYAFLVVILFYIFTKMKKVRFN